MVEIKATKKMGRGIFASQSIKKGEVIEIAPVIVLPEEQALPLNFTDLSCYVFDWSKNRIALALGIISLVNHSSKKDNVDTKQNYKNNTIKLFAIKDIKKGEQLFLDYGYTIKESKKFMKKQKRDFESVEEQLYNICIKNWEDSRED